MPRKDINCIFQVRKSSTLTREVITKLVTLIIQILKEQWVAYSHIVGGALTLGCRMQTQVRKQGHEDPWRH